MGGRFTLKFEKTTQEVKMNGELALKSPAGDKLEEPKESEDSHDENTHRGNWDNKMDFLLSCLGFAVGLGNLWRFPFLCYSNGGGAFLIPYLIMLALAGLPLFFLELAISQFSSSGCISIWNCSPIFSGLGYAMVVVTALVCIYYNVIVTWTIYYMFASLSAIPSVPWVGCDNWWNTEYCYDRDNDTQLTVFLNETKRPSEEYYMNYVLHATDMENLGPIHWQMALCFIFSWVIVFLCIIKGIKSSGKIVYFTALFPYAVLFILLVRGATLPGSLNGVKFFITPRWETLAEAKVWKDAAAQIFYSLGVAFGSLQTLGSYNRFHNNCYRDALIVAICNCATSLLAGFVIFSIIGYMAQDSGVAIEEVVDQGPGLAFIAYPEAVAQMPGAPFWAFIFFFMLFTLGLDSQFVMTETVITAILDELDTISGKYRKKKIYITAAVCLVLFFLGLPSITYGGVYMVTLIDWYSAGFSLFIIGILECLVVCYVYGYSSFSKDIKTMLGFAPNYWWLFCWMFGAPFTLMFVLSFSFAQYTPASYGDYMFPLWAEALGWMMVLASVLWIPGYAVYYLVFKESGTIIQRLLHSLKPLKWWGPALNQHRLQAGYQQLPDQPFFSNDQKDVDSFKEPPDIVAYSYSQGKQPHGSLQYETAM